jgi:hypothetical protein
MYKNFGQTYGLTIEFTSHSGDEKTSITLNEIRFNFHFKGFKLELSHINTKCDNDYITIFPIGIIFYKDNVSIDLSQSQQDKIFKQIELIIALEFKNSNLCFKEWLSRYELTIPD